MKRTVCQENRPVDTDMLVQYGPMYATYGKIGDGHIVVITGVDVTNNAVITNNPWGYHAAQSFDEFMNGYYTGDDSVTDPLSFVFRVNW